MSCNVRFVRGPGLKSVQRSYDYVLKMGEELQVVIQDTTYSLVKLPASDTQLVVSERAKLLGQIDLKTLVQDLGRVGMCIRVAYNGVTAEIHRAAN